MITPSIEPFVKKLVALMRDATIQQLDQQLSSDNGSEGANNWRMASAEGKEAFYLRVIADAVDKAIYNLLLAIDQETMRLYWQQEDDRVIELAKMGGGVLAANFSTGYWTKKYSKERHYHNTEGPDIETTDDVESFMATIVDAIRDRSIMFGDIALRTDPVPEKALKAVRHRKARAENEADFLSMIIADSVDQAVFYFLWAIDYDRELYLYYLNDDGEKIDLCQEGKGEMYGWYAADAWIKDYSKQRSYYDFDDQDTADFIAKLTQRE